MEPGKIITRGDPGHIDLQKNIGAWMDSFDPPMTVPELKLKLRGEMEELLEEFDRYDVLVKESGFSEDIALRSLENIKDEMADVNILLMAVADRVGFSLESQARQKMRKNFGRRWRKKPDGTWQHVKRTDDEVSTS